MLVFKLFTKELNASLFLQSSLSAQILSTIVNAICLNSSNDVYDSDTVILHWIISKSDGLSVQF